uniref:Uncharacterized protein n=1 Tax=Anguilla anguilla TaxID=7936 RepID=A0A0E9PQA5_ANGAN
MAGPIPDPVLRPSDSEMYLNKICNPQATLKGWLSNSRLL